MHLAYFEFEKPLANQSQEPSRSAPLVSLLNAPSDPHASFSFSNIEEGLFSAEQHLLQSRRLWYDGLDAEQTWVEDRSPSAEREKTYADRRRVSSDSKGNEKRTKQKQWLFARRRQ